MNTNPPNPASLLAAHPVFRSRERDAVHAFMASKRLRLEVEGSESSLDAELNGIYLPSLYVGYVRYGADVRIEAMPERDDYWLFLAVRGTVRASFGQDEAVCDAARALTLDGARRQSWRCPAGSARLQVAVPRDAMTRHLSALLGEGLARPVEFAPMLPLDGGGGAFVADYLRFLIGQLARPEAGRMHPIMAAEIEQMLLNSLLLQHRHNYREALERRARPVAPRSVKRAIDYIQAHPDRPLTLEGLAAECGVAGRTLQKHFQRFEGIAPLAYARRVRYQRVRDALSRGDGAETAAELAARWGFEHMGHFAAGYRRLFGETPSQTRARRRG